MRIILNRAEGPIEQCDKPVTTDSFAAADAVLRRWSDTAPEKGGYDKVDFTIFDAEIQLEYNGRYDLKHWRVERPNLKDHVVSHLEFMAGVSRPRHMTQQQYDDFLASAVAKMPGLKDEVRLTLSYLKDRE